MIAFAILTTIYALLSPRPTDHHFPDAGFVLAQLLKSFSLLRGTREILARIGDCLERWTMVSEIKAAYGHDIDLSLHPNDARLAID